MSRDFLAGRRIGISISDSSNLAQLGLGPEHVEDALVEVTRYLVAAGAVVVYGGDLRKSGFTELLLEVVARHQARDDDAVSFENFLAWPVHASLPYGELADMADRFAPSGKLICLTADGREMALTERARFIRQDVGENDWAPALTAMRGRLAEHCDARIVAGGATLIFKGAMPGVAEEALSSLDAGKPTFVLGGLGGCALDIVSEAGVVASPIKNDVAWPGRNRFGGLAASLNPGLDRGEAAALASATHGMDMLVLLLRGLHHVLPEPPVTRGLGVI